MKPVVFTFLMLLLTCACAQAYDPVNDFSIGSNQNVAGVWSYGQSATLGGSFSLLSAAEPVNPFNASIESWRGTAGGFGGGFPTIAHNKSSSTQSFLTVTHPADELLLHPGPGGEYAVLRFTAPTTGVYRFQGVFTGRDSALATTDVAIRRNLGIALFGAGINVSGGGNDASFDVSPLLTAGDFVDFSVGYGNGFYGNDSTGLRLDSRPVVVPEPTTVVLLVLPILGLAIRRCRTRG